MVLAPLVSTSSGGIASSASVAASTCSTVTPSAVSSSVARPSGKRDHRKLGDEEIHRPGRRERQRALSHDLRAAFGGVLHGDDHALGAGHKVHGAAHAGNHLARDHPVREASALIDLQAAQDRQVEMTAADQTEGHRAVEGGGAGQGRDRLPAGIGEPRKRHARLRAPARCRSGRSRTGRRRGSLAARSSRPASGCRCRD